MAGVTLGFLRYVLGFDSVSFLSGIDDAEKKLKLVQKKFEQSARKIANIGGALSVGITAPVTAIVAASMKGAQDQAQAMAQVDAALASMGNRAGKTREELLAASDAMEMKSLFDGDVILKQVTAQLLTFGNVAGQQFDRAQQAAIDMAARLGGEPQAAAIMLGKALNDPVKGITALTRVGVSFSEAQKKQIVDMAKAGETAKAQALILAEVEKQYGGAAAAAADTQPWRQAQVAMDQAGDAIGEKLLPLIPPLANAVRDLLGWFGKLSPETQKWIMIVAGAGAVLGPTLLGVAGIVSALGTMLPLLMKIGPAWTIITTAIAAMRVAALAALPALAPFLVPLGAIALAAGGVYLAIKNWDTIEPILRRLYAAVKTWLIDKLNAVWGWVKGKIDAVTGWFRDMYVAVVGNSYVPDMVSEIGQHMRRLEGELVAPAREATSKATEAFRAMQQQVSGLLERLFPQAARHNQFLEELKLLQDYAKAAGWEVAQLEAAIKALKAEYADAAIGERERPQILDTPPVVVLDEDVGVLLKRDLEDPVANSTAQVVESFANMARDVLGSLRGMVSSFKKGDILGGLMGLLDVIGQVASAFGGGRGGAAPVFNRGFDFGGFRANGGPVVPGKTYVVGENGPEFLTAGSRGFVSPGRDAAPTRVQIVPSPYFDAVVDSRAAKVAEPISAGHAVAGSAVTQANFYRRNRQMIPGGAG
ncbi:phage tail length tape measure family protein [Allosphingosinicella indica]|uniref:Prophage tail length tape measure protein n=1 Tax=Allosphingosinicella indica TaxID=941907 RepID=A0A1X7GJ89_9SPHN|nr:phage tail length tape measure family protein [Allosphingosinicella indica]SMF70507.1 Prophage tail length tape measure protein [Allosphingosinicella indica]